MSRIIRIRSKISSITQYLHYDFSKVKILDRTLRAFFQITDYKRWERNVGQIPHWDERNKIIAEMIPENNSVLDIGAGAQTLRRYLKAGCVYQPCDLEKTSDNIVLCDFNRGIYPIVQEKYNYVVCSGVLEYIKDLDDFLSKMSRYGNQVIITYAVKLEEKSLKERLKEGWMNHYSRDELEKLFGSLNLGWEYLRHWRNQIIWRLWDDAVRPGK